MSHIQKALDINVAANNFWGAAVTKAVLAYYSYYHHGKIDLQFKTTGEALRLAEESGDIFSKSNAYGSHGISCYGKGMLEEAEKYLLEGVAFCGRINYFYWY